MKLSNTNEIHFNFYNNIIRSKFKINYLSDLFEKAYYSHRIGLRKPDKEIYNLVLNQNNLKPKETLFIDDSEPNIKSAKTLGINSILLTPPDSVIKIFHKKNLI